MIENEIKVQGRTLSNSDVTFIRKLIQAGPTWIRWRLSREISTQWDWRNCNDQIKDMACRSMLLKLEKQGHITLPKRRRVPINRMLHTKHPSLEHDQTPIVCSLNEIQPIKVVGIWQEKEYEDLFCSLLNQHHYKGYKGVVGENIKPVYKGIEVSLRAQSVLHGDETGWRMNGLRWYMWVLCNRDIVYFHPNEKK